MSLSDMQRALRSIECDDSATRALSAVWPLAESILDSFAKATDLPLFAYLNGLHVFTSSLETMPPFCRVMLSTPSLASRCKADGAYRSQDSHSEGAHLCHAGLLNGRITLSNPFFGELVILYGSRLSQEQTASARRQALLVQLQTSNPESITALTEAVAASEPARAIDQHSVTLMEAIADILVRLFEATVASRALAITMAHELSQMMLSLGLLAQRLSESVEGSIDLPTKPLISEARLGLYIVHNFLSHLSEQRYEGEVKPFTQWIDLNSLIHELVELYETQATHKQMVFDLLGLELLPSRVRGHELEIRRAIHNVLNNAVKYSYHSFVDSQRTIRIRARVPYDPSFTRRRLAVQFETYGLGLTPEECRSALKPGFRGRQAKAEVPIGSGIGLSEVVKIMKRHGGEVRIESRELHPGRDEVYLTTTTLIFPY